MPDWEREAQRRLENTKFPAAGREEVARELAGYLEEVSSDARERGANESAAAQPAFAELREDPRLGANLFRARQEGTVNDRTKQLWLPGIATLFAAPVVGWLVQFVLFHFSHPVVLHGENGGVAYLNVLMGQDPSLLVYFLWLYALLFIGAAGAYWSRRAGSGRILQAAVALFPILLYLAISVGMEVAQREGTMPAHFVLFALSGSLLSGWLGPHFYYEGFGGGVLSWVIILGAALLLGAAGAYCSRRAGAGRILQAAVGLFPVLVFLALFARTEILQRGG
ncbi:MAG: hypothetical protein WA170_02310, partial [Candidatus Acidiferrales bacterium]